jgi:hypothetical protein
MGRGGSTLIEDVTQMSVFQTLLACRCWSVGFCVLCLASGEKKMGGLRRRMEGRLAEWISCDVRSNMVRVVRRCNAGGGSQRRSRLSPLGETVPYSPVDRLLRTCWSVSDSHTDTSDDPASRSNQAAPPKDPSLQTSPS